MSQRILIVEDRASLRRLMRRALEQEGYTVTTASDGPEGMLFLERQSFDLVLTDLRLPGADGVEVVRASQTAQPSTPVVVLTAYGTVTSAVEAMKEGASDFLEKPLELDDLSSLARSLIHDEPGVGLEVSGAPPIIGRHPALRGALRLLKKVAPTESTVLLTGETGTGKEIFARSLHALSPRAPKEFVALNCAAIPVHLVESELFGHEKGAFTGAAKLKRGRFELAAGGTLFLDEIGELDLAIQGKILRVLEERVYERVGGQRSIRADVRIVTATNRDLRRMAEAGEFRQDLLFRLDVFPIELPALRERSSDIGDLARHLLARRASGQAVALELEGDAIALLESQPWPGNVRQLANVLERASILDERGSIRAADLEPLLGLAVAPVAGSASIPSAGAEGGARERVREVLIETDGEKKRAAERLGISVRTLQRKVREYDLEGVPRYRDGC